jgi:hypothetical protein
MVDNGPGSSCLRLNDITRRRFCMTLPVQAVAEVDQRVLPER